MIATVLDVEVRIAHRSDMQSHGWRRGVALGLGSEALARQRSAAIVRRILSVTLLLCGGYVLGISTLGGCGSSGPTWPKDGQLPDRMIEKLAECAKKGPVPLESKTYNLSFIVQVAEGENEVAVEEVMLKDSTLQLHEVESCMADALHTMRAPLQVLALRRRSFVPEGPVSPESRTLLGQAEAVVLLEATGLVVVGLAFYVVVVYVLEDSKPKRHRPHPTTAEPPATAEPVATVEPLVTAAPVASMAPTTTAVPTATAVPTTVPVPQTITYKKRKNEKMCDALTVECLEHRAQPPERVSQWGQEKNCGACQRECYKDGVWPDYKCPRPR
ncbi:MAG: hypothetical protein U0441_05730 [Polyangiaceae bacterium]